MQIKVHWIIDGIADIEAETMEEAEAAVDALLKEIVSTNPTLTEKLGARALQGQAYLPGSEDDPEGN
jgi:hypothetical protein